MPKNDIVDRGGAAGVVDQRTTALPIPEALDKLALHGIHFATCGVRGFPFGEEVEAFVAQHDLIFIVEHDRHAQIRSLVTNELENNPAALNAIFFR